MTRDEALRLVVQDLKTQQDDSGYWEAMTLDAAADLLLAAYARGRDDQARSTLATVALLLLKMGGQTVISQREMLELAANFEINEWIDPVDGRHHLRYSIRRARPSAFEQVQDSTGA